MPTFGPRQPQRQQHLGQQHLGQQSFPEIRRSKPKMLLVPLGATEQHGPHLPLDTDTRIALAWCEAIAAVVPEAVIAPALPYGSSGEHQSFAGTLSIGAEALETVLVELGRSATESFRTVVFVSGHGGNAQPLHRAVARLSAEGRSVEALLPYVSGSDAHAGRTETSLMLHIDPGSVRLDHAEAGCTSPLTEIIEVLQAKGVAAVSANGVLGDPEGASAVEGSDLLAGLVDSAIARLRDSGRHQ